MTKMQYDVKLLKKQEVQTHNPDKSEEEVLKLARMRESEMKNARASVDKDRDIYQEMIDAVFEPYPDERSSSTVPLASAMIELYVAEATRVRTDFKFRGETKKHHTAAKAEEIIWKYDRRKNNRQKEMDKAEYIAAAF